MSQDIDQHTADDIARRIENALTALPVTLNLISQAPSHGAGLVMAGELMTTVYAITAQATTLEETGWSDAEQVDAWIAQATGAAVDAAGRVGMDLDDLEALVGEL